MTPPDVAWGRDIQGAIAELAFAQHLGIFHVPSDALDHATGDVAGFHVRSVYRATDHLAVRPTDAASAIYVLLVGADRHWRIAGWFTGTEAKDGGTESRYWYAPWGVWRVAPDELHAWALTDAVERLHALGRTVT